ncbi:hypothetical protein OTB20_30535 [Streptomyces sp. H27-H1]|uniref:hypothetical protein n=1 Tax=Streptomyces sp. H27-H1 TaxID=2996461 RepID=UPI00227091B1|nr:hypothetical protein [Streptomyces sp. H27-H1]MCY0930453.1 hypothetical protein [Streptomyces sp. H27-H1]
MRDGPHAELRRIESDPDYRERYRALLDAALVRRAAEREAFARAAADAALRLRGLLEACTADEATDGGRRGAVAVTLGAAAWTCCLAFVAARGGVT